MAIVTYSYYTQTYMGETVAETDFPRLESRAERIVTQITHGRAAEYAALPEYQQQAVTEAVCAQIEYYALLGEDVAVTGELSNGWSVGKVHVNGGASGKATGSSTMACPAAVAALELTGLLNPQVATAGEPPRVPYPWGWV